WSGGGGGASGRAPSPRFFVERPDLWEIVGCRTATNAVRTYGTGRSPGHPGKSCGAGGAAPRAPVLRGGSRAGWLGRRDRRANGRRGEAGAGPRRLQGEAGRGAAPLSAGGRGRRRASAARRSREGGRCDGG